MFFLRISCTSSSSRSHACITLAFPKLLHCTVHYTEIHVNYNCTIQHGITLLHHKAVFTNPCYYATLATMPPSLLCHFLSVPKGGIVSKFDCTMYADDLCCFCPSLSGLNKLLAVCSKYAVAHSIVFNACKSYDMMFGVKYYKDFKPKLSLDGKTIKFVDSVKYLGVFLTDALSDDCDITRQIKYGR